MSSKLSFASVDNILQNEEVEEYSETVIKDVSEFFEIDECVDFISSLSGTIENICLQFPDSLLKHAPFVASTLQNRTLKKCFTLADTSYGSCCVDEVAAKHVNAHAIVHFGHSCLSKTENLPVFYVFGKSDFNLQKFLEKLKLTFKPDEKLLIFYDVTFNYVSSEIKKQLSIVFKNVVFSNLITHSEFTASDKVKKTFGRIYKLNDSLTDYKIVYIGEEGSTLNNFIVHFNRNEFYSFSVVRNKLRREGLTVNKFLMKRFYLIEKAKDANIIGIVVSTLGVAKYKQLLDRIKTIIKNAQKTYYVILVGKINIPKLANFMEIDIFVNVACAESSNIDSKDFYKPIITPYELEIACLSNRQWTSDYVTDFSELLPGASHHVGIEKDLSDNSEPEYSLITGRLRSSNLYDNDKSANTTDIVTRDPVGDLVEYKPQNALEYLSSRSWKGLDKNAPAEVKKAEKGRQGIAMSYENETL